MICDTVLNGLIGVICENYIDDCIIYSDTMEGMYNNLKFIFERFRLFNLKINSAKCTFGATEVDFLGHVVSGRGIALSLAKKEGLLAIEKPSNETALKFF